MTDISAFYCKQKKIRETRRVRIPSLIKKALRQQGMHGGERGI